MAAAKENGSTRQRGRSSNVQCNIAEGRSHTARERVRRQQQAASLCWLALAGRNRFPPELAGSQKGLLPYLRACAAVATEAFAALGWHPESYPRSSGLDMHGWLRNQTHAIHTAERFRRVATRRANPVQESGV